MDWTKIQEYSPEDLIDTLEGLECDLDHCVELMVRVAKGEQTVQAMGEWVSLNYPKHRERLPEAMRALPPTREC